MLLPLYCFSQEDEHINGDVLVCDSLKAEDYVLIRNLFEDSVKIAVWRDNSETASCGSFYHVIENKSEQNLVVFFIEEENDTLPQVKLLRRKLLQRYGDFSFSVFVWDNVHFEDNKAILIPEFFVKILKPEEKFELVVPFANNDEEQIASEASLHLLICSETLFSSDEIGMPDFVRVVKDYGIDYVDTELFIPADSLKSFLSERYTWKNEKNLKSGKQIPA